jgi:hypothetical protein
MMPKSTQQAMRNTLYKIVDGTFIEATPRMCVPATRRRGKDLTKIQKNAANVMS